MAILQVVCPDLQGLDGQAGLGGSSMGTAPVVDTVNVYDPKQRASWKCVAASSGQSAIDIAKAGGFTALGNTLGLRWKMRWGSLPGVGAFSVQAYSGGNAVVAMDTDSGNHVTLLGWVSGSAAQIGSASAASIVAGKWHVFDLTVLIPASGNSTIFLKMDGVTVATTTAEALAISAIDEIAIGVTFAGGGAVTVNVTDVMLWDSTGSSHTAIPSSLTTTYKLALPVATVSNAGVKAGLTATTGEWDALNNTPPVGVAMGSATATSQITDATSSTTDNVVVALQTPASLGISQADTIGAAIVVASLGNSTTTARSMGVSGVVPTVTEATASSGGTAAGTWPTGWTPAKAIAYAPTISDVNANLQAKWRKNIASTDNTGAASLAMVVEHTPVVATPAAILFAHGGAWV